MTAVRCSNCGFENSPEMAFCTNCGKPLTQNNAKPVVPNVFPAASAPQLGRAVNLQPTKLPKKSNWGRNTAIFASIGCLALFLGAVAMFSLFYYVGRNLEVDSNANYKVAINNSAIANQNQTNRRSTNVTNNNPNIRSNSNVASTKDVASTDDAKFRNFLPAQIGQYEQQGGVLDGTAAEDYPGADKIIKSNYLNDAKRVNVILAEFDSHDSAKNSFGNLFNDFKSSGAKIVGRQKVKNNSGVETGEIAFYNYKGFSETSFYADKYGFRIAARDQQTLIDFVKAFSVYLNTISN